MIVERTVYKHTLKGGCPYPRMTLLSEKVMDAVAALKVKRELQSRLGVIAAEKELCYAIRTASA